MSAKGLVFGLFIGAALACSGGCATSSKDGQESPSTLAVVASGVVKGAKIGKEGVEILFIRLPDLLFGEIPEFLLLELPREGYLLVASRRACVATLIRRVELRGDDEAKIARATRRLRETTGLPFADGGAWIAWWGGAQDVDPADWLPGFVSTQINDLDDEDFLVRESADARLRDLAGVDVGYDAKGTEEERSEGRAAWVAWRDERFGGDGR